MSHIRASSQPPPSAYPATAAMTGLWIARKRAHRAKLSSLSTSTAPASAISAMSAPAANARSSPVDRHEAHGAVDLGEDELVRHQLPPCRPSLARSRAGERRQPRAGLTL